ncbi:MAG: SpoIIE family protein phosphatase [Myxococcota bacterium]
MRLELAHRTRPHPDETENGDAVWLGEWIHRPAFAVFDGSGHGREAAEASARACAVLDEWDGTLDLPGLVDRLHRDLRGSRGCAALVAVLDERMLRGFGVGNVELRALNRTVTALLTPGILGARLRRKVNLFEIPLRAGDRLLVSSDGVKARVEREYHEGLSPADLCDSLLRDFARSTDDATVLAADVHEDP